MKDLTKILLGCILLFAGVCMTIGIYFPISTDPSHEEMIENLVIDESPRIVEETEDYIIIERDFKADEFILSTD